MKCAKTTLNAVKNWYVMVTPMVCTALHSARDMPTIAKMTPNVVKECAANGECASDIMICTIIGIAVNEPDLGHTVFASQK